MNAIIDKTIVNADLVTAREFRGEKVSGFGLEATLYNELIEDVMEVSSTKYVSLLNDKIEIKKDDDKNPNLQYHSRTGELNVNLTNVIPLTLPTVNELTVGLKTYSDYPDVGDGTEGVVGGTKSIADNFLGFNEKITEGKFGRASLNSDRDAITIRTKHTIPFIGSVGINYEERTKKGSDGRRLELSFGKIKLGLLNGDKFALSDIQIQGEGEGGVLKGHKLFLNLREADAPKAGIVLKRNIMTTEGYDRKGLL